MVEFEAGHEGFYGPQAVAMDRVLSLARQHHIALDDDRVAELGLQVDVAQYQMSIGEVPSFHDRGLSVTEPIAKLATHGEVVVLLDFEPGGRRNSDDADTLDQATKNRILLELLETGQNYALLVDAGVLPRPERLEGTTNPRMAAVARALGFRESDLNPYRVEVDYTTFRDIALGQRMAQFADKLRARIAARGE